MLVGSPILAIRSRRAVGVPVEAESTVGAFALVVSSPPPPQAEREIVTAIAAPAAADWANLKSRAAYRGYLKR